MSHSNKDAACGGFVVSNNVLVGRPVGYSFREQSGIPQLNGWTLYSVDDDQEHVERAEIFRVVAASTVAGLAPIMLEILKLQMLSGLMGSYHPLQACAFRRFMDLPAHMKLRWQSFPHKRIVTTVLSAPAVNSSCPRQPSRAWRTSGGTRLTHEANPVLKTPVRSENG